MKSLENLLRTGQYIPNFTQICGRRCTAIAVVAFCFALFNLLSAKQISTVPNLQRHDVDVQTTLQRCVMALNAPMKLAHLMF